MSSKPSLARDKRPRPETVRGRCFFRELRAMGCRCKERAQIIRRTVQEVRQGNTSNVGRAVAYNVRTLAGDIRNAALSRLTRRP